MLASQTGRVARWFVYYPHASVVHHGQRSVRQNSVRNLPQFYRSYCVFYRKHHPHNRVGLRILGNHPVGSGRQERIVDGSNVAGQGAEQRNQARNMRASYRQVLRLLSSL